MIVRRVIGLKPSKQGSRRERERKQRTKKGGEQTENVDGGRRNQRRKTEVKKLETKIKTETGGREVGQSRPVTFSLPG